MKIFNFEEKTGISQSALAAFVTATALGVVPFFGLEIATQQAINLGLCSATAIGWGLRQYHKAKNKPKMQVWESPVNNNLWQEPHTDATSRVFVSDKTHAEIAAERLKEDKNA